MYKIGQLSKLSRVSARTIRYYEELGLLTTALRKNNYRYFSQEHLLQLNHISCCKDLGFSLEEIKRSYTSEKNRALDRHKALQLIAQKEQALINERNAISKKIDSLLMARENLQKNS